MGDFLEKAMELDTEDTRDFLAMAMTIDDGTDFLAHHGVTGMHWYERRYQNEDGSLTALGRIHYGIGKAREKRAVRKVQKVEKAEAARAKKVEKLIQKGDVDAIYKHRELFTREELKDATERISNLSKFKVTGEQLQKVDKKQMRTAKDKIDKIVAVAGTVATVYGAYNTLAKEVNSVTGENTLPNFGQMSAKYWSKHKKDPYVPPGTRYKSHVSDGSKKEGPYKWNDKKVEATANDLLYTYGSKKATVDSLIPGVKIGSEGGKHKVTTAENIRNTIREATRDESLFETSLVYARTHYGGQQTTLDKELQKIRRANVKEAATKRYIDEWTGSIVQGDDYSVTRVLGSITGTPTNFDWNGRASSTTMSELKDLFDSREVEEAMSYSPYRYTSQVKN